MVVPRIASRPLAPAVEVLAHPRGNQPEPLLYLLVLFCCSRAAVAYLEVGQRSSAQHPVLHVDAAIGWHFVVPGISFCRCAKQRIDTCGRCAASLALPGIRSLAGKLAKMGRPFHVLLKLSFLLDIGDGVFLICVITLDV